MSLSSGTTIARYEILSQIGRGGMGEVYLARDSKLGRQVALKILNKTEDPDRVKRFVREARAASALNHPNILSVYDFGQQDEVHFIVTEFVAGKTLREMITEGPLDLKQVLGLAIQIGASLEAAHRAGIVHRDIKPENIIVSSDGFVKVLDFGLAKLFGIENVFAAESADSTVSLLETKPGLLVGTVNYMSPEQLRGEKVDERTDLWSLGVVLFEMVTGDRPFTGNSMSEVIAAILERQPPSPELRGSRYTSSLEKVLLKALTKSKEARYQSAGDIIADLKRVHETVTAEDLKHNEKTLFGSPERSRPGVALHTVISASKRSIAVRSVAAIAALTLVGIGLWSYSDSIPGTATSVKQTKVRTLPVSGNVLNAVLSPNGQFIAYIQDDAGQQSLRLRQVAEDADSVLIAPQKVQYAGIQFSPDSNSLFYTVFKDSPTGELYRKPLLASAAQKILDDVDSSVAFSPDGKQFAFIRTRSHEKVDQIIVADLDGNNSRILSQRTYPDRYSLSVRESLSWSHDGKTIACAAGTHDSKGERMTVVLIDVATGSERPATSSEWLRVGRVIWGAKDQTLIITGAEFGSHLYHIWRISPATDSTEKVTSELNDYLNISLSADSRFMLAVADDRACNLFSAPTPNAEGAVQIAGGNLDGIGGVAWTGSGKIIYVSMRSGNRDIWISDPDGKNTEPLTFDKAADDTPSVSKSGDVIAYSSSRTGVPHIWLMNGDGTNSKQLTNEGGETSPQIAPDGSEVFYSADSRKIWRISTTDGRPRLLTEVQANWIAVSPDGSKVAGLTMSPGTPMRLSVFSTKTGELMNNFELEGEVATPRFPAIVRWTPDGKAITYVSTDNGVSNIVIQPLSERKSRRLTNFSADRIFAFDWSRDGGKIAFARGTARNELLLFEDF